MTPSDRGSRSARWRSPRYDRYTEAAEIPLLALSVLLIPVLVLPEISKLGSAERAGLDVIDCGVWAVFIADYLTRLGLARNRTAFIRGNLLDLALVALPMLRPLRLARATRLVRFALILTRSNRQAQASPADTGRCLCQCPGCHADARLQRCHPRVRAARPQRQHPYLRRRAVVGRDDCLHRRVWDRYPVTLGGRVTAVLLIGAGVSLFGVITAAVAAYFIRRLHPPRHQRPRPRRGRPARPARTAASRRHPHRERSGHRNPAARGLPVTVNIRAETIRAAGVVADRWATRCQAVAALSAGVTSAASDARSRPRTSPRAATVKKAGVAMRPVSIFRKVSTGTPAAAATSTMLRSPRA